MKKEGVPAGTGVASDQMEKLFDAFVTSKLNGTGVGLRVLKLWD